MLLLGDADPPTLLETSRCHEHLRRKRQTTFSKCLILSCDVCRLILTCVSQKDVSSLWLQRIRPQKSVRGNLLFIMSSSTNSIYLYSHIHLIQCYVHSLATAIASTAQCLRSFTKNWLYKDYYSSSVQTFATAELLKCLKTMYIQPSIV